MSNLFKVVERRKQIEIEEQEIRRKEKELMSTVKLPAEAEGYKVQTIAEGKRYLFKVGGTFIYIEMVFYEQPLGYRGLNINCSTYQTQIFCFEFKDSDSRGCSSRS